jgi:hypothetical protein
MGSVPRSMRITSRLVQAMLAVGIALREVAEALDVEESGADA